MIEYNFDPRALPERLRAAIGLAITSFAQTEQIVEEAIAGCCRLDIEYGKAITAHMAMPLRLSVLRSVAEIRIDDLAALDELDELIEKLEDCIRRRNDLAHRTWCQHPITGALFTVKHTARTRLETDLVPMTIERVEADAKFIYDVGMAFFVFQTSYRLRPVLPAEIRSRGHKSRTARKKRKEKRF